MKQPNKLVRFDSKAQMERAKRAAKIRRWDLNQYIVFATEQLTEKDLATAKAESEQLINSSETLSLNQ